MKDLKSLLLNSLRSKTEEKMRINRKHKTQTVNFKIISWHLKKDHLCNKEKMKNQIKGKQMPSRFYLLRDLFLKVTIYSAIEDNS